MNIPPPPPHPPSQVFILLKSFLQSHLSIKKNLKSQDQVLLWGKEALLQESTGAAVVCNKKRNPVSSWFPGPQSCILMHLLHLTTGNEITRSSGVSLCLAGKGCTGGSLPLPKQAPADPAQASGALCQADKPCQVDKPSVAWFCSALPAARGLGARRTSVLVFLEQGPRCESAQSDPS